LLTVDHEPQISDVRAGWTGHNEIIGRRKVGIRVVVLEGRRRIESHVSPATDRSSVNDAACSIGRSVDAVGSSGEDPVEDVSRLRDVGPLDGRVISRLGKCLPVDAAPPQS